MSVVVERAFAIDEELRGVFHDALKSAGRHRGGRAYLDSFGVDERALDALVDEESLWVARDGEVVGFGVCSGGVIMGLYVIPTRRRGGIARALVSEIIATMNPKDAHALPGDRAMKSLYESFGWKARLLTMRAD
ncbi:MAG: GNAT family N-acetyltransferase [Acidobacteriota bacterium]|nr:GNAT family N-acetyltransferase [Acidobacteriota bacterium]MDE3044861.1 GNAT family N-acetyltransferase [Acidobacteriota bacterium]